MSFREKSAWIAVIATLVIWGYYFFQFWETYVGGTLQGQDVLQRFLISFGITIVVLLALNLWAARLGKHRFGAELDERERTVERRAKAIEAGLLELMALGVAIAGLLHAADIAAAYPADPAGAAALVIGNAILFVVLVSQVVHELALIVQFRMMD